MPACEYCGEIFDLRAGLANHRLRCSLQGGGSGGSASSLRNLVALNASKRKQELKNRGTQPNFPEYQGGQDFSMDQDDIPPTALFDVPLELPAGTTRKKRLPRRFIDHLPSSSSAAVLPTTSLPHLLDLVPPASPATPVATAAPVAEVPGPRVPHITPANDYGLFRIYDSKPSDDPDDSLVLEDVCDSPNHSVPKKKTRTPSLPAFITDVYAPFKNATTFLLTEWMNREVKEKSYEEIDALVHRVICHPLFNRDDLRGYSSKREADRIDKESPSDPYECRTHVPQPDGWREGMVKLRLPAEDRKKRPRGEADAPEIEISGIYYRPLLETIFVALDDTEAPPFHYTPYEEYWERANGTSERVYGEVYASDSWRDAHAEIQSLPKEEGIENCVLPIMLYSDSTHLANFGKASLWPIYMYFAGHSKYMRSKITESACHHLAYIPSLPATVQEVYEEIYGRTASANLLTHLKRELVHAILHLVLFQPEFMEVYTRGTLFQCTDGIIRRLFPRFIIYSADYPERMLIGTIRNNGLYPSAADLTLKKRIHLLGTPTGKKDRVRTKRVDNLARQNKITQARKAIFQTGLSVESAKVKNLLKEGSLVPVNNAFSILAPHGFNFYNMFVPDLMHEFELGVWKTIFIHTIRILVAEGGDTVTHLNRRYRETPTFGTDTIRRFTDNTAAMRKLAARDYEDILQCALPVFEDLLPKRHNKIILDLLFLLATWHAYAKLRLHTETTVRSLDQTTSAMANQVRLFKRITCAEYDTHELQKEVIARGRREAAMVAKDPGHQKMKGKTAGPKRKDLNVNTPKFHALGGYADAIRQFGTSDSYSTQIGETQHKRVKRLFGRTNKQNAARDISKLEARVRRLREIRNRIARTEALKNSGDIKSPSVASCFSEPLPKTAPRLHFHTAATKKFWFHPYTWISENDDDPALTNFMQKLRSHILGRILSRQEDEQFAPAEIGGLHIKRNRLYRHKVLRINYTSYDLRRLQDSLNPRTHADIMLLSTEPDTEHPYVYARIVGLFHADIAYSGPGARLRNYTRMDMVWVRSFQYDSGYLSGFEKKRLPRIQFMKHTDPDSLGFIDPELIIRAAHLIPSFSQGRTRELLPHSLVRPSSGENVEDYLYYYVNISRFADRDMFMRYRGGGIGHKATWHLNEILMKGSPTEIAPETEMDVDIDLPDDLEKDISDADDEDISEEEIDEDLEQVVDYEDNEDEEGEESEGYADL